MGFSTGQAPLQTPLGASQGATLALASPPLWALAQATASLSEATQPRHGPHKRSPIRVRCPLLPRWPLESPKSTFIKSCQKPLPLQHPSPPRPCIVLALPTFSFLRLERLSSVHRRALAPHRAPPCSILSPVHAHLPSHLFRPRTDVTLSSLVRGGLEGFYLPPCQHRTTPTDQRPFVRSSNVSTWAASPQASPGQL